ncbi:MAG TPA: hypothetical protein VG604_02320 [Candidatus Saccharimonadales bacterium]|nr:hypothetical protein [Candidatus Saccharimonadales bacterium]
MVERVIPDSTPRFEARPRSLFAVPDMPPAVEDAAEQFIHAVIGNNDSIEWIHGGGAHGLTGDLPGIVTRQFVAFAEEGDGTMPHCKGRGEDSDCMIEVAVETKGGVGSTAVRATCPLISELDEETAIRLEARCLRTHGKVKKAFGDFAVATMEKLKTAEAELESAKSAQADAQQDIDRLTR